MRRGRRRRHTETAELNITAFMNLMVILVPFLLITAVFSRVAILQLDMPAPGSGDPPETAALELEITLRADRLEVADRERGLLRTLPAVDGAQDLAGLAAFLLEVKTRFPEHRAATLLLEPEVEYDALVQTMDAVRVRPPESGGSGPAELFPDISIGDAVPLAGVAARAGGD